MNYINPFHLLATTKGDIFTPAQLKLAKKRYLAEFELTGAVTIDMNGQEMDKNGLLKFFEGLESERRLNFHKKIFDHKPLLNFLEQGELSFFLKETEKEFWSDKDFVKFVGSYFSAQFANILLKAIKQQDAATIDSIFNIPFPLQNPYKNDAYKLALRYYHREITELDAYKEQLKEAVFVGHGDLIGYIHPNTIGIFNQLPSYFEAVRSAYALALQKLAILLHNDYRRTDLAMDLLEGGLYLSLDKHTKEQLEFILKQLGGNPPTDQSQLGKKRSTEEGIFSQTSWTILFFIVFLALFTFLGRGCSSNNDTIDFNNLPTLKPSYETFDLMDSVIDSIESSRSKLNYKYENKSILDSIIKDNHQRIKEIIENNK